MRTCARSKACRRVCGHSLQFVCTFDIRGHSFAICEDTLPFVGKACTLWAQSAACGHSLRFLGAASGWGHSLPFVGRSCRLGAQSTLCEHTSQFVRTQCTLCRHNSQVVGTQFVGTFHSLLAHIRVCAASPHFVGAVHKLWAHSLLTLKALTSW